MIENRVAIQFTADTAAAYQSVKRLETGFRDLADVSGRTKSAFASIGPGAGAAAARIDGLRVELLQTGRAAGLTEAQVRSLSQRMAQTAQAVAMEQSLRDISAAAGLTRSEVQSLGRQMGLSAEQIKKVADANNQASQSSHLLGNVMRGLGAYFSISAVINFAGAVKDAGMAMDSLERSFSAIAGGRTGAAQELAFLRIEAERLGQSFYDLAPQFKNISAAARGTSLEGETIRKVFSSVGGAATALGISVADTEGILLALSQMISKGTVQAEELRGQLGERLPGAFGLAAKAMGVTTQELGKMLEGGNVLAEDLLPKLADELNKVYAQAAETAALESAQAAINRLSQEWTEFKTNLFDTESFVWFTNFLRETIQEWNRILFQESVSDLRAKEANYSLALKGAQQQLKNLQNQPDSWLKDLFGKGDIERAEEKVARLVEKLGSVRGELAAQTPVIKDHFTILQEGMDSAGGRAQKIIQDLDEGHKKVEKYIQTEREKITAERDGLLKYAQNQEERDKINEKFYARIAKLDAQESARHTASLNKRIQEAARAAREQEQIAKGYYDYIGKGAKGSIEAAMAEEKRLYELRTAENQKAKISAEELAKWQAKTDEEYKRRQLELVDEHNKKLLDSAIQYYRYVGEQADGYLEHQIKVLEAQRDAELKRVRDSIKNAEERARKEKAIHEKYERDVTNLVEDAENKRQAIRESIQQKIFDLTATDAEKRQAALTRELADYRKQLTEAGDYTAEEIERVLDRYREAYERANDPVVKDFQKAWDSAVERLDNSFLDLWKSFLEGGKASLDAFKHLFKNLLAELAHAALTRPIIMQIGGAVSGSLFGSAATTALAGQQGGGAAGMLGNLPFGSLFSGGSGGIANSINSWAASSFPSVWGAGGLLGPSVVNSGYTAAISNPSLYTSGMGFSSEAVATGALQGTGYGTATNTTSTVAGTGTSFLSTIGGLAGIGGGIYQMTQGGAGNIVGGAGTAIGGAMMFTPAAPFAPLVMLGSQLLGGLLGGKKEHSPSIIFQAQETPWGQTEDLQWHSKSKASWKMGNELAGNVGQVFGATFEQVEGMLGAYGDQYVDMLKDATVTWGRKAGGAWKEWDFGTDMKPEELMEKVVADIQGQVFKAAGPAFSKVGEDFADSGAVKNAYALLENKAKQFGQIEDVIRAGVQDGNVEAYIQQLHAFQTAIANTTATWEAISRASAEVVEPLSAYEQQQRQLNAQYDGWIASLSALGIAQENIQKIEEDRTAALEKMAEDNAKAIQNVIDASAEAVTPLDELSRAQRQINAQFDGMIAQLNNLGAAAEYATQVEANRQAALAALAAQQAQAATQAEAQRLNAIRYAQAELSGTVDQHNINEIATRYGWGEQYIKDGQINRENVQRDAIDWFKTASKQSVDAMEAHHGVEWQKISEDVKYLDSYFKKLDEAAKPVEPKISTPRISEPRAERVNTAVNRTAEEFERLTRSLVEFRSELLTREESGLTVEERYRAAENEFERISQLASLGNKDALERLQEVSNRYLDVSGEYHATASDYRQSSGAVLAALDIGAREAGKKANVDMAALKKEVQQLREEQAAANYQLIKWIQSVARISNRWDNDGMPGVRQ